MSRLFPWHRGQWSLVSAQREQGHIPHALLLEGRRGLGKRSFAGLLAQSLLCEAPDGEGEACGACRSCHLFASGAHPHFMQVEPEGEEVILVLLTALNDRYKARFSMPFIMAVKGRSKEEILAAFRDRLDNDPAQEFATALKQIERIALLRLKDMLP